MNLHFYDNNSVTPSSIENKYVDQFKYSTCYQITDASIISISTHCTGLQSLHLVGCGQITVACIISISTHCTGLQSLNLGNCVQITDISIISISKKCKV